MADLDDVLTALTSIVAGAIYPANGGASVVGAEVKIYPGWPTPNELDADLLAGNAHASVYPRPEERNTTRCQQTWQEVSVDAATGTGKAVKEVGRQERVFQVVIWAASPEVRTAIARVVDPALRNTPRFALPDSSIMRLAYKSSPMNDMLQKAAIYRRDFFYTVEYVTTIEQEFYAIKTTTMNFIGSQHGNGTGS